MTMRLLKALAVTAVAAAFAACAPQSGGPASSAQAQYPKMKLPPVRTAHEGLSARDRAAYVIAVQRALEKPVNGEAQTWKGRDGGTGSVTVVSTYKMSSGRVCRIMLDTIKAAEGTIGLNDVACWSGKSWFWLRKNGSPQVLAPLATFQLKRTRSFRNLAKRVKAKRADLKLLNPLLGDKVEVGTVIYLPRAG